VARRAFLDSQFDLQHRHYIGHYANAAFLIVERAGSPLGRLYLHADGDTLHIIDILLLSAVRGQGVGTALLAHVQQLARDGACNAVELSVLRENAGALRLYQRLGFTSVGGDTLRLAMRQALS
jgi:ribosomal protein S18 acetylase RimI-like enzyme